MTPMKVALVRSRFYDTLTQQLHDDAVQELLTLSVSEEHIYSTHVPGAMELPLMAQFLAELGVYDAIIVIGVVIRGETDHYDHVARNAIDKSTEVGLTYRLPVISCILTTQTMDLAKARVNGEHSFKGKEAAGAAVAMIQALRQSKQIPDGLHYA